MDWIQQDKLDSVAALSYFLFYLVILGFVCFRTLWHSVVAWRLHNARAWSRIFSIMEVQRSCMQHTALLQDLVTACWQMASPKTLIYLFRKPHTWTVDSRARKATPPSSSVFDVVGELGFSVFVPNFHFYTCAWCEQMNFLFQLT